MMLNVGMTDRLLRIGVGGVLIVLSVGGLIGAWGYVGILPLLTGVARFSLTCSLVGVNTCPLDERE